MKTDFDAMMPIHQANAHNFARIPAIIHAKTLGSPQIYLVTAFTNHFPIEGKAISSEAMKRHVKYLPFLIKNNKKISSSQFNSHSHPILLSYLPLK